MWGFLHSLNQRLSIWQGENVANVPWILGQWMLARYFQQQNHNESNREEERTAGQEMGNWSSDSVREYCDWKHKQPYPSVCLYHQSCWDQSPGISLELAEKGCWGRQRMVLDNTVDGGFPIPTPYFWKSLVQLTACLSSYHLAKGLLLGFLSSFLLW